MKLKQLYFISFIEGGVVMVTEIAGAKLLTPFFGASLYSWAATLSITLLALMTGYYYGGYVTTKPKYQSPQKIVWVFITSGIAVLLMPSIGHFIMQKTISFSFFTGLILSELFFLFFPIFLMGMISPMIIFQITKKAEQSGRSAGNIYAISTCGGILFTLVFGFLIIPTYGITLPVRVLGLAVALIGLVVLLKEKLISNKNTTLLSVGLLIAFLLFSQDNIRESYDKLNQELLVHSEGLLGELKVTDEVITTPAGGQAAIRKLKTNNIQQNYVFVDMPTQSLMYYVNFTNQLLNFVPKKESALLIGLGAGSLYSVLSKHNFNVESVEIDQRIYDFGVKYFGMPSHKDHHITDGRYFINVVKKKYDVIILDVIIGESVPAQLITLESFKRLNELLNTNGTLILEHGGVSNFSDNSFIPSIVKTLNAAGFQVSIFNPLMSDTNGDVLFMATKEKFDMANLSISDDVLIKGGPLANYILPLSTFKETGATVLTDDINNIDLLLKTHYQQVRKTIRKELAKQATTRRS